MPKMPKKSTSRVPANIDADPTAKSEINRRYKESPVLADTVARMLGYTPKTVYELAKTGQIPSYRWGGAVRFYVSEIEAWIAAHRCERAA